MIPEAAVETNNALDELRPGSVILDSRGTAFQKWHTAGWQSAGPTIARKVALPAKLIHQPEAAK